MLVAAWKTAVMKSGLNLVGVLAASLVDVNFSTGWPSAVSAVLWHHPNCRPETTSFWILGHHFNFAKGAMKLGSELGRGVVAVFISLFERDDLEDAVVDVDVFVS